MAFDGTNIWVANYGTNTVSKLKPNDGTVAGTFPVGGNPIGVAFDGANIWVANAGGNMVTKLRARRRPAQNAVHVQSLHLRF
jgi:YVTN family beta-propeller protein